MVETTKRPSDNRVRQAPHWLRRSASTRGPTPREPQPERSPWQALTADAEPADLADIAALKPSPPAPADAVPVKVGRRKALWHLLATRLTYLSLKTRVGALVAVVVGLTVAITSLAAFFTIRTQIYEEFDSSLVGRAQAVVQTPGVDFRTFIHFPRGIFAAADTRMAAISQNPQDLPVRVGPEDSPPIGAPERAVASGKYTFSLRTVGCEEDRDIICPKGSHFRVVAIPASKGLGEEPSAFILAENTSQIDGTLRALGTALLVIGVAGVVLATYAGVLVARRGLRPVTKLTRAAEHVAQTGQLRPIEVRGSDELARLGNSFNAMLAAVERSRERQRRLVADAGHELRTPLTSLRTNLDLLQQAEGQEGLPAGERIELLDDVRAQVEELTGLVSDLVELARDDAERWEGRPVDLAEVVAAAAERARRRAPEVTFDVRTRPWTVFGDLRALERAVLNLLDNAGKWSPPGGTVTVRLSDGALTVADEGPGIAEADLPYVFERFYRSEESRTMPGSGLGLAIVRQVAERHGGTVMADRAPRGGALMLLRLPHASSVTHTEH